MSQHIQQRLLLTAVIAACGSLLNACDDATRPTTPASASSTAAPSPSAIVGGEERLVTMMDACDPATFEAAGVSCIRSGGVTFQQFLDLLGKHQSVGSWHFSPGTVNARVGQTLLAVNRGGEEHTFTEVEEFGGGFVPPLNELSGNPVPAPECLGLPPEALIAPGGTYSDEVEEPGTEHYQCCIHPWMRMSINARP